MVARARLRAFFKLPRWDEKAGPRRDALSSQWKRTQMVQKEASHEEE